MRKVRFIYWKDEDMWLGYLEDYPDYMTQGQSLKELQENLKDIHDDLTGGHIPGVLKVAELQVA
jgi:predicted RNase H-like HicB family nuclease